MFAVLSPAKKLDFTSPLPDLPPQTLPRFLDQSAQLVDILRQYSPLDISKLMKVSDRIATLNVERYALWDKDMQGDAAKPAAFALRGDTYQGLDIDSFSTAELAKGQKQLRILSGLYGLLRPLDRIRPYRLEMGTRLPNAQGKDLYHYWGTTLTEQLEQDMQEQGSDVLVNLASNEYFKAIQPKQFGFPIVMPVFKDEKNGTYKVISFYAKRARGMMAGWIIKNAVTTPQ